ncbi:MAG: hypothetical protein R2838_03265 [Caldilineaceae bacterium]
MAMGVVLGISAGVPAALLFLAVRRTPPGATARAPRHDGRSGHGAATDSNRRWSSVVSRRMAARATSRR